MIRKLLVTTLFPLAAFAQGYNSYFTGNTTNITTNPEFGICMMGGATEHDNAMIWLLEKANGGDVVVLRSSGSNGYNDYLYSELGVPVNSVETLVITSVEGATNPYVLDKVANAEMIWFAGGDQWNYVSYFKNNALEDLINNHVNVKHAPIGGTSAGMAILGGSYFSAQNGSISSAQALSDPFHPNMSVYLDDFLQLPFLSNVITDTHYDNPDRRGRHMTFLARLSQIFIKVYGIACNEYVAVCVGEDGLAHVYGDYPNYQEFAYFIHNNCANYAPVDMLQPGVPLTWDFEGAAIKAYKIPGTMNGTHYFDLKDWEFGAHSGGSWEDWSVDNGTFLAVAGELQSCVLSSDEFAAEEIKLYPMPFTDRFSISGINPIKVNIHDMQGRKVYEKAVATGEEINASGFSSGMYLVVIEGQGKTITRKIVKN